MRAAASWTKRAGSRRLAHRTIQSQYQKGTQDALGIWKIYKTKARRQSSPRTANGCCLFPRSHLLLLKPFSLRLPHGPPHSPRRRSTATKAIEAPVRQYGRLRATLILPSVRHQRPVDSSVYTRAKGRILAEIPVELVATR